MEPSFLAICVLTLSTTVKATGWLEDSLIPCELPTSKHRQEEGLSCSGGVLSPLIQWGEAHVLTVNVVSGMKRPGKI